MTVIIRIVGFAWLVMTIAVFAAIYLVIWTFDGANTAASSFTSGSGLLSLVGVATLLLPGVVLLALAAWLDRRDGRWSPK